MLSGEECGGDNGTITLNSSTCSVPIGTAVFEPCAGPIGTEHSITVEVNSTEAYKIAKVTVEMDSEPRGKDEYRLTQDSSGEGAIYKITLISVGSEDETRDDVVRIKLWEEDPDAEDDS